MAWEGFNRLDLSGVEAERGRNSLKPGSYTCITKNAEMRKTKDGAGWGLWVELHEENGAGAVADFINLANRNPDATRIGQGRLKALLEAGGHPNPDRPGDIKSVNGLRVGVHVEQDADWVKDGKTYKGGSKPRRSGAYFKPGPKVGERDEGDAPFTTSHGSSDDLNDDVPW